MSILAIPDEVLLHVLCTLPVEDLGALARTCRQLRRMCKDDSVWERACARDLVAKHDRKTWRDTYKRHALQAAQAREKAKVARMGTHARKRYMVKIKEERKQKREAEDRLKQAAKRDREERTRARRAEQEALKAQKAAGTAGAGVVVDAFACLDQTITAVTLCNIQGLVVPDVALLLVAKHLCGRDVVCLSFVSRQAWRVCSSPAVWKSVCASVGIHKASQGKWRERYIKHYVKEKKAEALKNMTPEERKRSKEQEKLQKEQEKAKLQAEKEARLRARAIVEERKKKTKAEAAARSAEARAEKARLKAEKERTAPKKKPTKRKKK